MKIRPPTVIKWRGRWIKSKASLDEVEKSAKPDDPVAFDQAVKSICDLSASPYTSLKTLVMVRKP
jgi:hypothetical protein